jgi:flagellar FliL protein
MAEEELEEDLDLGEEKEGGSKKKLIIIGGAALLVIILAGGGAWFFLSGDDAAPETAETEEAEGDSKKAEGDTDTEKGPAMYHTLKPLFVVNLPKDTSAKMMQIGVDVMVRSPELLEFVQTNDPMIRHRLLNLFSAQDASKLRKRAGKEKLQEEVKAEIQKVVTDLGGPGEIEAVYFTSFVMQ